MPHPFLGALPVHPYDLPAAKQPSIGPMNRKVYQLEANDEDEVGEVQEAGYTGPTTHGLPAFRASTGQYVLTGPS